MDAKTLSMRNIGRKSKHYLRRWALTDGGCLDVPCPSIGSANSNLDLAYDYLKCSFVAETIASSCERIDHEMIRHAIHWSCRLRISTSQAKVDQLVERLLWLAPLFGERDVEEMTEDYQAMLGELDEFQDTFDDRTFAVPELANSYMANLVVAGDDIDEEALDAIYQTYPERRFNFWRFLPNRDDERVMYVSSRAWIVPLSIDLDGMLRDYGGFEKGATPVIRPATTLKAAELPWIVASGASAVVRPDGDLSEAIICARECALRYRGSFGKILINDEDYALRHDEPDDSEAKDIIGYEDELSFSLSDDGRVIVAEDFVARYVLFSESLVQLGPERAAEYVHRLSDVLDIVKLGLGLGHELACAWDELDDEQFEQLCYDLIYYSGDFDLSTIKKLGSSRSRDGGRDIEAFTHWRAGRPPRKWVIQCKLNRGSKSLGASKLNIADTVLQYRAGGYGLMTSGLVDATVYDRLDGISKDLQINTRVWSRLELERFLARVPEIRRRYFGDLVGEQANNPS